MDKSTEKPLVSVIMPTYNGASYILQAIDSCINQDYGFENMEILVVDDRSTDNTSQVLQPYLEKYSNIHYHLQEQNGGPAKARNKAIELASGDYIAFLDSDDYWYSEKVSKQVAFMKENDALFSCTDYLQTDENLNSLNRTIHCRFKCSYDPCVWYNPIGNSTVMLNIAKMGKVYIPLVENREDYAMWLYLLREKTKYAYGLRETLTKYRILKKSFSSNKLKMMKHQYRLYRRVEHFCVLRALFHVAVWCVIKVLKIK